jgi:hypothetical protein
MTDLLALLDTLLPGNADFPKGSRIARALLSHDRFAAPVQAIRAALPPGFSTAGTEERIAQLSEIEQKNPDTFAAMIVGAYSLYYTDLAVTSVLARLTGHSGAAPQPTGHALAPFDPALLAIPAARAPLYRPTPEAQP